MNIGGIDAPSGEFDFSQPSPDDVALRKRQGLGRGGHQNTSSASSGGGAKTSQQKLEAPEEGVLPHINLVVVGHVDAGKSTLMVRNSRGCCISSAMVSSLVPINALFALCNCH